MGKFDGILICTDLDGTLYRSDKTISPENMAAIEYFKREGGLFTFITGRMPNYSQDAYNWVKPNVPYGCVNGGGLYDGAKEEYVWTCQVPEAYRELIAMIDRKYPKVGIQLCTFENTLFAKDHRLAPEFRRLRGLPDLTCDYRTVREPVGKIIFMTDDEEEIRAVEQDLRTHPLAPEFGFVRSEQTLFEILPKGVHKGLVLEKLIDYLQIDPKKTIAIGDYDNDIGMFHTAKYGVAVANACQAALDAADIVTVSNEEHAIAHIIHAVEKGEFSFV